MLGTLKQNTMISFKKLEGPYGIPVYFQHMPDMVQSVSMSWTILVGSADDESVGAPGLYHWFEHVPFRGTKEYPGGYKEIKKPFTKNGGFINASTGQQSTNYFATVPLKIWRESLSIITDLLSQPLLTEEGINAEREIIVQEIAQRRATSRGNAFYELPAILWPDHPLGHNVLGSEETLRSMTASVMQAAHKANYDRSRCVFFIAGNIDEDELMFELKKAAAVIPDHGLSEKRVPESYGPLPAWKNGQITTIETSFKSSVIFSLFPIPKSGDPLKKYFQWNILENMFAYGDLDSPLSRILRDERKLVYNTSMVGHYLLDGGYCGFMAEAQSKNIDPIVKSFGDVLRDSQVYSPSRLDEVKTGIAGSIDIEPVDTSSYISQASRCLISAGKPFGDNEYLEALGKVTPSDIKNIICSIDPSSIHTVIFKGTDK